LTTRRSRSPIADDPNWATVSLNQPCPVCVARVGCATAAFQGGMAVICRNVVTAWPVTTGGWLHRLALAGHPGAS